MADVKISALTALTTLADDDELVVVDTSATETKRITFSNLSTDLASETKTLTNKSIDLANNTLTGTLAQFNTAVSDATLQTQGDVLDDLNTLGTVASDGQFIVGTGAGSFAYESGATARTSLGLGTGDSPQFSTIELGHATDTTLSRSSAGVLAVEGKNVATEFSKSITIEDPTSSEDITMFFTNKAITVTEIRAVLVGSSTPSVTWTIRHGTDRSATGAEVVTSGTTTTSTTTGSDVTSFNDATVVADSFVWLETTAQSGTVTELAITVFYTID